MLKVPMARGSAQGGFDAVGFICTRKSFHSRKRTRTIDMTRKKLILCMFSLPMISTSASGHDLNRESIVDNQMSVAASYAQNQANLLCRTSRSVRYLRSPFHNLQKMYSNDQAMREIILVSKNKVKWKNVIVKYEDKEYIFLKHIVDTGQAKSYIKDSPASAYEIFILSLHVVGRHKNIPQLMKKIFLTVDHGRYSYFLPMLISRSKGDGISKFPEQLKLPNPGERSCFTTGYIYFRARYIAANKLFIEYFFNLLSNGASNGADVNGSRFTFPKPE